MSTRANIIITQTHSWNDENNKKQTRTSKLYFYRHSDGYPEGVMPTLSIFMDWLNKGVIRNNAGQGGGWLILLGAMEYNSIPKFKKEKPAFEGANPYGDVETIEEPGDWKCGAYEPTTGIHGDIEYLYIIDIENKTLKCFSDWDEQGNGKSEVDLSKVKLAS